MKSDEINKAVVHWLLPNEAWERLLQSMRILGMDEGELPMAQRRYFAKLSLRAGELPALTVSPASGESVLILGEDCSKYQEILEIWGIEVQIALTSIAIDIPADGIVRWAVSGLVIE